MAKMCNSCGHDFGNHNRLGCLTVGCTCGISVELEHRAVSDHNDLRYRNYISTVTQADAHQLQLKDKEYGGSWKRRGGVGAYMMAARKIDRIEEQLKKVSYDVFAALESDTRSEGLIDDIRDLRRYLVLIEAEILARNSAKKE